MREAQDSMHLPRPLIAAAILFLQCALAGADTTLHRSNEAGMILEPIPAFRRDEYEFVMEVERTGDVETRRLFQSGKVVRRWEIASAADGARTEREFSGSVLAARRAYNPSGSLLWEETYADGKLSQKSLYEYTEGHLVSVRVQDAKGALIYKESYMLSDRGSLRQVRRVNADGTVASSWYAAGGTGLGEEREDTGDASYVRRFDPKGRLTDVELWKGGEISSRRELTYRGDSTLLLSAVETIPAKNTRIDEDYDAEGRLLAQRVSVSGAETEHTDYTRNKDGTVDVARRVGPEGVEEWRYTYTASGDVATEKYYRKGSLEKVTVYTAKGERYEELYKDNELFLRAYYKDDAKTKEEVWDKGVLVRERSFT